MKTVNFCLDGLKILSGSEDTSIRHWDLATGSCITTLRGHKVCVGGKLRGHKVLWLVIWGVETEGA